MFDEFVLEVFFIKVKVKATIKNITDKTEEKIDTFGTKNKNKITYHNGDTKIKLEIHKDNLILVRENKNFIHTFDFKINKETNSEYYIKEYNTSIDINVLTTKLVISDNRIILAYIIKDSSDEYNYILDME